MSSITINSLPICLDHQFALRGFMEARLPPESTLFSRWQNPVQTNPLACGNAPEYLHSPYPELPAIKVGELQWPTGASRYGRALYAVDWPTISAIMVSSHNYVPPTVGEPPVEIKPDEIPFWSGSGDPWNHVVVEISGSGEGYFRANMFPLSPIRITGTGVDLWLLPLVDCRFRREVFTAGGPDLTWEEAIAAVAGSQPMTRGTMANGFGELERMSYANYEIGKSCGEPDPRWITPDHPQFAVQLLDAAALACGVRIVHNPMTDRIHAITAYCSDTRRETTLAVQPGGILGEVSTAFNDSGAWPYLYLPRLTSLGTTGSYAATGLPAGLEIDSVTGRITGGFDSDDGLGKVGGPTESGIFTVGISRGGQSYSFTLVVISSSERFVTSPRLISGGANGSTAHPGFTIYTQREGEAVPHGYSGGLNWTLPVWTTWEEKDNTDAQLPDGTMDEPYSYSATVGTTGSYAATNLPPGLTIHSTTGEISGTPTESGVFEVAITRGADSATLTIKIFKNQDDLTDSFINFTGQQIGGFWAFQGSQYCFAGPISYEPCGFDDFCSIDLFEINPGEHVFRTRIYELPQNFVPIILANGETPSCARRGEMYRFEITEDIASGDGGETPATTIIKNFPKTSTITEEAILVNVDGMIDGARAGFVGECKYEARKYWFVQAACGQICDGTVSIPAQTPGNARINQTNYAWTPSVTGTPTAGSWAATGLPADWGIDVNTGEITGPYSGVVGPEQFVEITITCTGPKSPPAVGVCTSTRKIKIRIVGA